MSRKLLYGFAFGAFLALAGNVKAQVAQPILPQSAPPQTCMAGTGASIVSVGTTPITICAASPTGKRIWWRITNTGSQTLFCSDDGTTPTATFWNFTVASSSWTISSFDNVSPLNLVCVTASSTTSITADAAQNGAP
jgi:hypothetical protein